MRTWTILCLLLLLVIFCVDPSSADGDPCIQSFRDGWKFNLTSLRREEPYVIGDSIKIYFNICGDLDKMKPPQCAQKPPAAAYAVVENRDCVSLGSSSSMRWFIDPTTPEDINIAYVDGEACGILRRAFRLAFHCGASFNTTPSVVFQEPDGCTTSVWWETAAACPERVTTGSLCAEDIQKCMSTQNIQNSVGKNRRLMRKCLRTNLKTLSPKCASALPHELQTCIPDAAVYCTNEGGEAVFHCMAAHRRSLRRRCRKAIRSMLVAGGEFEINFGDDMSGFMDDDGDGNGGEEEEQAGSEQDQEHDQEEAAAADHSQEEEQDQQQQHEDDNSGDFDEEDEYGESRRKKNKRKMVETIVGFVVITGGMLLSVGCLIVILRRWRRSRFRKYSKVACTEREARNNSNNADIPEGIALEDVADSYVVEGIPLDRESNAVMFRNANWQQA